MEILKPRRGRRLKKEPGQIEAENFGECANKGQVFDKDAASEQLTQLPDLYRELGVGKRTSNTIVEPLQTVVLNGTRIEQVAAARQIASIHNGITESIYKASRNKIDK